MKTHPSFRTYKPQTNERPRVLTFIRRDVRGYTVEGPPGRDILYIFLPNERIIIINIYHPLGEGCLGRTYLDILVITA